MSITIKKNRITHTVMVAIATLAVFAVVGLLAKSRRGASTEHEPESFRRTDVLTSSLLVPTISLPVSHVAPEADWSHALAKAINGNAEVQVAFGRADVMTDEYAIEVDFLAKWKEGLGQALHYGDAADRTPVLALVVTERPEEALLKQIEKLTASKGVRLVLLTGKPEDEPTRGSSGSF